MDVSKKQIIKKRRSIVKLSVILLIIIIGFIGTFCSFVLPFNIFHANRYNSFASSIKLGIDLKGGVYALYDVSDKSDKDNLDQRLDVTKSALQNLLVSKGYTESIVVREGATKIRVEVPDVDNPKEIFTIIGEPTAIEFSSSEKSNADQGNDKETFIRGDKHLKNATAFFDSSTGKPSVRLELNKEGTTIFSDYTTKHKGEKFYIHQYQGAGKKREEVGSAMAITINDAITNGIAIISGSWTGLPYAKQIADKIMSGTFSVQLQLIQSDTISATLGQKALSFGLLAGIIGVILVVAILCFFYRLFGLMASIALMLYIVLLFFFLAVLPWVQLTLPGIAGIILSIGMAVDANIIIFERIKDEYKNGKSIVASTYAGFKRALKAIVDANVTTFITSVVLVIFGRGSIKGFGITLLIGLLVHLFTSLIVCQFLIKNILNINSKNAKLYNLKRKDGSSDNDDSDDSIEKGKLDNSNVLVNPQ